jgi:uncharacterized membrane protein
LRLARERLLSRIRLPTGETWPLRLTINSSKSRSSVALVIQAGAVLVVTFGAVQALGRFAAAIWQREANATQGREIWLKFATWILLALEFALAADLVRTAVAPTWDDIGKLAVIATIRTMLNYFLAKDIAAFDRAANPGAPRP